jgi:hypothetical protein
MFGNVVIHIHFHSIASSSFNLTHVDAKISNAHLNCSTTRQFQPTHNEP